MEEKLKLYKTEYFLRNLESEKRRIRLGFPKSFVNNIRLESILIPAKNEKNAKDKFNSDIRLNLEEEYGDRYTITSASHVEEIKIRGYNIIIEQSI